MKKVTLFIALLMSLSFTASLFAAESKVQQDVDLIFQSTPVVEPAPEAELVFQSPAPDQSLEVAVLSEQEMAETEGAWLSSVIRGVVCGTIQYVRKRNSTGAEIVVAVISCL